MKKETKLLLDGSVNEDAERAVVVIVTAVGTAAVIARTTIVTVRVSRHSCYRWGGFEVTIKPKTLASNVGALARTSSPL